MEREQTTLRLPAELLSKLREEAQERGLSLNALILHATRQYVLQHGWLHEKPRIHGYERG